mmetsp:Transcript_25571/g.66100  ORF Transcript_25571/g.66100 Transcript_25571/m.66100 type:complete len:205 (-) Transcript_25571:383-997(-)
MSPGARESYSSTHARCGEKPTTLRTCSECRRAPMPLASDLNVVFSRLNRLGSGALLDELAGATSARRCPAGGEWRSEDLRGGALKAVAPEGWEPTSTSAAPRLNGAASSSPRGVKARGPSGEADNELCELAGTDTAPSGTLRSDDTQPCGAACSIEGLRGGDAATWKRLNSIVFNVPTSWLTTPVDERMGRTLSSLPNGMPSFR